MCAVAASYRLPMTEQVGCGTPCLLWSLGVREVVGSRLGRGNSKESCSSNQETGKGFSPEMPFYSKFKKFWSTKSPWGSVSYRPSASPSYEASSHVNNYYAYSASYYYYYSYTLPPEWESRSIYGLLSMAKLCSKGVLELYFSSHVIHDCIVCGGLHHMDTIWGIYTVFIWVERAWC